MNILKMPLKAAFKLVFVVPTGQRSNSLIKDLIEILIFSMKRTSSKSYSRKRNSAAPYILR